jgi:hypothetical protein
MQQPQTAYQGGTAENEPKLKVLWVAVAVSHGLVSTNVLASLILRTVCTNDKTSYI